MGYSRSTEWDRLDGNVDAVAATSADGTDWTLVTDPETLGGYGYQWMLDMASGGPGFVAVGDDFKAGEGDAAVWTSVDGTSWTRVPHSESVFGGAGNQRMWSVARAGPGFVAAGYDGSWSNVDAAVWTSVDGAAWTRIPHDPGTFGGSGHQLIEGITAGGPGVVAVGHDASGGDADAAVWTSVDGTTWTRLGHDEEVFGGSGDQRMFAIATMGTNLIAVGENAGDAAAWVSSDGNHWTRITDPDFATGSPARMLAVTPGGPGLVAGGYAGSGVSAAVWTSPDGYSWHRVPHDEAVFGGDGGQRIESIAAGGSGLIAVGGEDSAAGFGQAVVWTSPDGFIWQRAAAFG